MDDEFDDWFEELFDEEFEFELDELLELEFELELDELLEDEFELELELEFELELDELFPATRIVPSICDVAGCPPGCRSGVVRASAAAGASAAMPALIVVASNHFLFIGCSFL